MCIHNYLVLCVEPGFPLVSFRRGLGRINLFLSARKLDALQVQTLQTRTCPVAANSMRNSDWNFQSNSALCVDEATGNWLGRGFLFTHTQAEKSNRKST